MWKCPKCNHEVNDHLTVCYYCGTSKTGVADPGFQTSGRLYRTVQLGAIPEVLPASPAEAVSPAATNYEFEGRDNQLIGQLGERMSWVGLFSILIGALCLLGGVSSLNLGSLLAGFAFVALGSWMRDAGYGFERVTSTQGSDIHYLMRALSNLNKIFGLLATLILIVCVIFAVGMVVAVIAGIWAYYQSDVYLNPPLETANYLRGVKLYLGGLV
jgi:hypothetical protein